MNDLLHCAESHAKAQSEDAKTQRKTSGVEGSTLCLCILTLRLCVKLLFRR